MSQVKEQICLTSSPASSSRAYLVSKECSMMTTRIRQMVGRILMLTSSANQTLPYQSRNGRRHGERWWMMRLVWSRSIPSSCHNTAVESLLCSRHVVGPNQVKDLRLRVRLARVTSTSTLTTTKPSTSSVQVVPRAPLCSRPTQAQATVVASRCIPPST